MTAHDLGVLTPGFYRVLIAGDGDRVLQGMGFTDILVDQHPLVPTQIQSRIAQLHNPTLVPSANWLHLQKLYLNPLSPLHSASGSPLQRKTEAGGIYDGKLVTDNTVFEPSKNEEKLKEGLKLLGVKVLDIPFLYKNHVRIPGRYGKSHSVWILRFSTPEEQTLPVAFDDVQKVLT